MRAKLDATVASRQVPFELGYYLMEVSAGADGVYAGTTVVRAVHLCPDELVRIDRETLQIVARASFPASVVAIEWGQGAWASIGDGRVVRLDPVTLTLRASEQVLPHGQTLSRGGSSWLSIPAVGLGSVWVVAWTPSAGFELLRLDPSTLSVLSKTRLATPVGAGPPMVIADSDHVYLVWRGTLVRVGRNGELIGRPIPVRGLTEAQIYGSGLVGLTRGLQPSLVLLNRGGRIVARSDLPTAGVRLSVSGSDAWF